MEKYATFFIEQLSKYANNELALLFKLFFTRKIVKNVKNGSSV